MSIFNLYVIYIICKSWISHDSVGLNHKEKINKTIAVLKYNLCAFFPLLSSRCYTSYHSWWKLIFKRIKHGSEKINFLYLMPLILENFKLSSQSGQWFHCLVGSGQMIMFCSILLYDEPRRTGGFSNDFVRDASVLTSLGLPWWGSEKQF